MVTAADNTQALEEIITEINLLPCNQPVRAQLSVSAIQMQITLPLPLELMGQLVEESFTQSVAEASKLNQ